MTMTNNSCGLNQAAEAYYATFRGILKRMICGMTNASLTDSISHNFIVQMIPHHRAAIQMSRNILIYTANQTLQDIALNIINEQTKSIENMLSVEQCCSACTNAAQSLHSYQCQMDRIMQNMFSEMQRACTTNRISCDFMREMIPHHEGAVKMSETTLHSKICPELTPILEAIITSQKKGIAEMQSLLQELECA